MISPEGLSAAQMKDTIDAAGIVGIDVVASAYPQRRCCTWRKQSRVLLTDTTDQDSGGSTVRH